MGVGFGNLENQPINPDNSRQKRRYIVCLRFYMIVGNVMEMQICFVLRVCQEMQSILIEREDFGNLGGKSSIGERIWQSWGNLNNPLFSTGKVIKSGSGAK